MKIVSASSENNIWFHGIEKLRKCKLNSRAVGSEQTGIVSRTLRNMLNFVTKYIEYYLDLEEIIFSRDEYTKCMFLAFAVS